MLAGQTISIDPRGRAYGGTSNIPYSQPASRQTTSTPSPPPSIPPSNHRPNERRQRPPRATPASTIAFCPPPSGRGRCRATRRQAESPRALPRLPASGAHPLGCVHGRGIMRPPARLGDAGRPRGVEGCPCGLRPRPQWVGKGGTDVGSDVDHHLPLGTNHLATDRPTG